MSVLSPSDNVNMHMYVHMCDAVSVHHHVKCIVDNMNSEHK